VLGDVDTLCAFAAEVAPTTRQRGLAAELLAGIIALARRHRLRRLIAPVRPSWKDRYPLAPIERYITWRRADGELLDPWMRLHERLGARVATALPHSMRITGTVHEWETWTALALPESGAYVFPSGLAPPQRRLRRRSRHLLGAERLDDPSWAQLTRAPNFAQSAALERRPSAVVVLRLPPGARGPSS
jgi:hypothetical protein